MSSPGLEMSLEHQIPVLMKKTQMNGEHGAQCGLTSLLPMSCRGRAAAFARDLHTRLRNLGSVHHTEDDAETSWLPRESSATEHHASSASPRDHETFYDFELECESPSSPVDEFDSPFPDRSNSEEQEPPFYDFDSDHELKEAAKHKLQQPDKNKTNGFSFSASFYTDSTPVKLQPVSRENGHKEKQLFSAITFEDCAKQNGNDEVDCIPKSYYDEDLERLRVPAQVNSTGDSDSEFESAKSDPSDEPDESFETNEEVELKSIENEEVTESIENSTLDTNLIINESESALKETNEYCQETFETETATTTLEIITSQDSDKELSPTPEVDKTLLNAETESNEEDDRPQRVRRCSSLKTGKTPPGTPGRKKIVRFADVLGLDLADIKTFMDEIPVIPKSAYDDLTGCDMQNSPPVRAPASLGALTLVPLFQVPKDVNDKLERQNVCLESARVGDGIHINICGSVRVRNLDFHKTVHIRYTMNSWKTYTDLQATYVPGTCDGYSDRFQFILYAPCISSGQRLEIAVRFQCKGQQFWDNNSGINYCFDCLALGAMNTMVTSGPLHPTVDWHPSFY